MTSLVAVVIDNDHVPVPTLYLSLAGSTALIWVTRSSQMCVTLDRVHVSITEIMFVTLSMLQLSWMDQWFEMQLLVVAA